MLISSLISAIVALVGVASWDAGLAQHREINFKATFPSAMDVREIFSGGATWPGDYASGGDCLWKLKPPSGCAVVGSADEIDNARSFKLSDGASQISNSEKRKRQISLVSAAAPLLLSAIAGLAFAGGGRRYKR